MADLKWLQWNADERSLIISHEGCEIVIEGIDLDFAEAFAEDLNLPLIQKRAVYMHPDVKPQVKQCKRGVVLKLLKYPKYKQR